MAYEQKDGTGGLFSNPRKQPGDNRPDREGYIIYKGERIDLAEWTKTAKSGDDWGSLKATDPADRPQRKASEHYENGKVQEQLDHEPQQGPEDDIPF